MRYVYICLLLGIASICDAQLVLQPEGLEPGDQYRLIFTTSQKRDATSANIDDYNNFVQSVADSSPEVAAWGLEWRAIVSTPTVDAVGNTGTDWRVEDGIPIYRVDGALAYEDNHDLWLIEQFDQAHSVPLDVDEFGHQIMPDPREASNIVVFTGTNEAGTKAPIDIDVELRGLGASSVVSTGWGNGPDPAARFSTDSDFVDAEHHFYAISTVLTTVPEPQAGTLLLCAVVGIGAIRNRRIDVE